MAKRRSTASHIRTHLIKVVAASLCRGAPTALFCRQHGDTPWLQNRAFLIGLYAARNTVDRVRPVDLGGATFAELLLLLGTRLRAR